MYICNINILGVRDSTSIAFSSPFKSNKQVLGLFFHIWSVKMLFTAVNVSIQWNHLIFVKAWRCWPYRINYIKAEFHPILFPGHELYFDWRVQCANEQYLYTLNAFTIYSRLPWHYCLSILLAKWIAWPIQSTCN